MKIIRCTTLAALALLAACGGDDGEEKAQPQRGVAEAAAPTDAEVYYADEPGLSPEELERGRLDSDWTAVVTLDTTGSGAPVRNPEKWEQISAQELNRTPIFLPLGGDVAGPSVLRVQVLLDRALFSPGIMDGRWGKNTAKAVYFFQQREGIRTTGRVDSLTFERLAAAAGQPRELVRAHRLTAEDVKGPFVDLPDSIYDIAKLDCTCYETLTEKLSETFHVTPELLEKLNPGVSLDGLQAGQTVHVPNVRDPNARAQGQVAELVVSGQGSYVHAVDAQGRILYHFPSTLGATYDPTPQGDFKVTGITKDPWWHYQPALLSNVPDDRPDARIPPGPNNAVGRVWMSLSVPHYGIHGTKAPETIGYATSSGCVRLTNWDALFLADRISRGTPVSFRDIQGRAGGQDASGSGSRADSARRATPGGETTTPAAPATRPSTGSRTDTAASSGRRSGTSSGNSGARTPARTPARDTAKASTEGGEHHNHPAEPDTSRPR